MVTKKTVKKKAKKPVKKEVKKERQIEKELLYIFLFLGFLVIVFLIASSVFASLNRVEYEGLVFTEEKFGNILVFHYSYSFRAPTGNVINYNLYLRNDPSINDIPITGDVNLNGRTIHITLDTAYLTDCSESAAGIGSLSSFFRDNQFIVRSGNVDFVEAYIHNQEYITCENTPNKNVVQIYRGNSTEIVSEGQCTDIIIGPDCQVLKAVEKYQVHAFLDAQR